MKKNEKGFVLVFVIAVTAALSIMTSAMYFYYDSDLKSVSRNSVMQQVTLASETGLQEGQRWIANQLNSNTFSLTDIQNSFHIDDSDNACLNRHGFTNQNQDVYYAKRIQENLGADYVKFEDVSYEVFIQRQADVVRSIYFSEQGSKNNKGRDTTYIDRSFALVENFKDFPTEQFTIEMWIKNKQPTSSYDMHLFEWGRTWDLVFKVKNDEWSPRLGEVVLDDQSDVGDPVKDEWVHIAWVWEGGDPEVADTKNVKIYQNGVLSGTFNANIGARKKSAYTNPPEILPEGNFWPLAIGEGVHGFSPNNYLTGDVKIQSTPWLGNISEMRIWNVSRSAEDIANNRRKRLTGSEPGLVSYYKFNEGTGSIAKDYNTSRNADDLNDATIYGLGTVGTLWETEIIDYPVTSTDDDTAPSINVPPGEDLVYYKILSCGSGPQGQIVPLELVVSAPVQKGDVGDGNVVLTPQDLNGLSGQEGTPLIVSLENLVGDLDVEGDITIQETNITNTDFFAFKRSMDQCNNSTTFIEYNESTAYDEGACVELDDKLLMLEKDAGTASGDEFNEEEWSEVLGSDCDGVQFKSTSGDASYGHYYKYFSTAPNITSDLGYKRDSISWWEAKRRAEKSTCGGMRGYLVSVETAAENEFIKDAVMCDNSTASGCTGVTPFHVAAGETRANYYGSRLDTSSNQHYLWLANSDWRTPRTMRSESGPNMGSSNTYVNWQSSEPNNGSGEDYADMEINRSGRTNGGWNDLRKIPNCSSNGRDCITGYVVEYGGFDSFRLDHDDNGDGDKDDLKDLSEDTKTCVARATIEKDKYVSEEDYLKYDNTSDEILDGSANVSGAESFDTDLTDDYPGWDVTNGVLTLFHSDKPADWNPNTSYVNDSFTWFNNRVWKNISGSTITGGASLAISETPTIYNPSVWQFYSGNESDAPCGDLNFWQQAFESIKYFNTLAIDTSVDANPYNESAIVDSDDAAESLGDPEDYVVEDEGVNEASLGERVIIFSLGSLHVNKHRDGYNHFYEFYEFPARAAGTANASQNLYNDKNRRMNEAFSLSRHLEYFGKSGYLATVTSETENNIITEKAVGNGWMGGLTGSANQNSVANLNKCGGFRQRDNTAQATLDFNALRDFEDMQMYREGVIYTFNSTPSTSTTNYVRNIVEKYSGTISSKTILSISKANPAVITTSSNHGLTHDDIIKIADISTINQLNVDGMTQLGTSFYRVRVISNSAFSLVDLDTRENINSTGFSDYTASTANLWELEGIQNELYRLQSTTTANNTQTQSGLKLFYKDPKIALSNSQAITGNRTKLFFNASLSNVDDSVTSTECPVWRWMTGPESMLWEGRGLAFAPTRTASNTPSANNGVWTRADPSGQQIGEVFVNGMPFRNWNGTGEPNNAAGTEHGIHLLGTHFSDSAQLTWNDLHNWNASYSDNYNYTIRGLILEYGGLESVGDPITRIAAKRIINLFDRRVTKATITISSGAQTGDKLTAPSGISDLGLTVTGDDTNAITFTGEGSCKIYLDTIKGITFEHTGATEGVRQISITIGDVKKPTGSDHYYKKIDELVTYQAADFQASYSNLCGLQGYLANVTTTADLTAISTLGITNGKEAWINGTDECQGGIYRAGFWRYSSGPWKDKEFWRLRIDSDADIDSVIPCNLADIRSSEPSVRVGSFKAANWISNHPAANNNDYLTYKQSTSPGIKTRSSASVADVEAYIVRYGGSAGDFTGVDIEEVNDIKVLAGPLRAEISFYTDSSDNSIFISGEDKLKVPTTGDGALSAGWTKTIDYSSQTVPLTITPPSTELITMDDWRRELTKVYYKNINLSNFTPGNRKIKITLVYGASSLNQTIGIVKTIGSKNKVTVTPISWSNR